MNKTEKTNIYIDEKTKNTLLQFCTKHHVSFSTVIDNLLKNFIMLSKLEKQLKDIYLNKGNKTSVKVKDELKITHNLANEERSRLYSNLIYLYFNKKLKSYFKEKEYEHRQATFIKEINKCTEQYWNYNNYLRNTVRMLKNKTNRKYLEKKLEQYNA